MKITIRNHIDRATVSVEALVADYKAQGMDQHQAYDQLIKERGLRPDIGLKSLYQLYSQVQPELLDPLIEIDFRPNLIDLLCNQYVEAHCDPAGVWHMIWQDGTVGSFPPCDLPDPERFTSVFCGVERMTA